jgi:hypothetical protein
VNNRSKYADGFNISMIDEKNSHITSSLFMFTCTGLCHSFLEWQKNKGVHPKASKSQLKVCNPERSDYYNYMNNGGKIATCCTVTGHPLLISPGIADMYTFLKNTWNTLPEHFQHRVDQNTLSTVNHQIQQVENPMPAVVISVEAGSVDNPVVLGYLTSEVVIEEPEFECTDPNIPIDNNCMDD